jgi:hypothetical protein
LEREFRRWLVGTEKHDASEEMELEKALHMNVGNHIGKKKLDAIELFLRDRVETFR